MAMHGLMRLVSRSGFRSSVRGGVGALIGILGLSTAQAETSKTQSSGLSVQLESIWAWQGRNDVEVPNDGSASRFALDELTGRGPFVTPRLELAGSLRDRHEWRILLAPLAVTDSGVAATPIDFQGRRFAAGPIAARYQFDSWRVTWRYRWIEREDLQVRIGFTAKIRDASIRLRQGALIAVKDNTGFVPLLHASFERPLGSAWTLEGDVDALAGGPGYAVDGGLRAVRRWSDEWSGVVSVRYLDGGADNDEVYAFARFTSATVGVRWTPR